ncbi:hypothetical protein ACFQAS_02000 [Halopenitus salinus]|uniref:DUF7344 domain-containing protein n=1 Tax=Halopenitus salinus TaxID=1198295 RepID=A0ABD5UV22_9EURY
MTEPNQDSAMPLDPDDAFQAVSNSRRRQVLLSLSQTDGVVSVSELAREIAAIENLIDPGEVSGEQRTTVYIALIQSHLGMLDDIGVIAYDERAKQVESTEVTKPVAQHIREITSACYEPEDSE